MLSAATLHQTIAELDPSGRPFPYLPKLRSAEILGLPLRTSSGNIVLIGPAISALLDNAGGAKRPRYFAVRCGEKALEQVRSELLQGYVVRASFSHSD
jgi:hypothetical protein